MSKIKTITIDPKMFIGKPFIVCPKCKKQDSYGLLMVNPNNYTKRCKECWYSKNYLLPQLNKKVIYLDQFVISNMMKAINDQLGKKEKVDKVYLKLFEELDKAVKLQLVICPDSTYHREESLLSFYKALKRMYEHLSHSTSFYDSVTIRRFQLSEDFRTLITNKDSDWRSLLDTNHVLHGNKDEWQSKYLISIDSKVTQSQIDSYRAIRDSGHESIKVIFKRWQQEKSKPYRAFFKEIATSYGEAIANKYVNSIMKYFQGVMGVSELTPDDILSITNEESVLISSLLRYLPKGANDAENLKKIISYLRSERLETIPFNEIYSTIWAAIAYQASRGGRISSPNAGMFNDIEMIATLSPYCDAIFVDKDMYSILNFGEVKKVLSKYRVEVFSLTNKDDFFKYLEKIGNSVSKKHNQTIKDVYGEDWEIPYYEMYEHKTAN